MVQSFPPVVCHIKLFWFNNIFGSSGCNCSKFIRLKILFRFGVLGCNFLVDTSWDYFFHNAQRGMARMMHSLQNSSINSQYSMLYSGHGGQEQRCKTFVTRVELVTHILLILNVFHTFFKVALFGHIRLYTALLKAKRGNRSAPIGFETCAGSKLIHYFSFQPNRR